jgi:hypothetical protein
METSAIISILAILAMLTVQGIGLVYFYGKLVQKVDGLKEDRNETLAAIKDLAHAVYQHTQKLESHGNEIQALKTWREIITPTISPAKRNGTHNG